LLGLAITSFHFVLKKSKLEHLCSQTLRILHARFKDITLPVIITFNVKFCSYDRLMHLNNRHLMSVVFAFIIVTIRLCTYYISHFLAFYSRK
ncbi:hypothetical protein L9F63_007626, partial [Diploptera punctata]